MVRIDNHLGKIEIQTHYFANLIGYAASNCFGVAGLVSSDTSQGIRTALAKNREIPDKGVRVRVVGGELIIDLHIIVTYGVNISAIVKSIVNKVTYTVEKASDLTVSKVNVYVADMKLD